MPAKTEGSIWRLRYVLSSRARWKAIGEDIRFKKTLEDFGFGNLYMTAGPDDFVAKVYENLRQAYIATFDDAGPIKLHRALEGHSVLEHLQAVTRDKWWVNLLPESKEALQLLDNVDKILSEN